MKVWLVFYRWPLDYESGDTLVGVFSTNERANAAARAHELADHGTHYHGCPVYDIDEATIDEAP